MSEKAQILGEEKSVIIHRDRYRVIIIEFMFSI